MIFLLQLKKSGKAGDGNMVSLACHLGNKGLSPLQPFYHKMVILCLSPFVCMACRNIITDSGTEHCLPLLVVFNNPCPYRWLSLLLLRIPCFPYLGALLTWILYGGRLKSEVWLIQS